MMLALTAASVWAAPQASAVPTYMSCGYPPVYSEAFGETFDGKISYRQHPRHCAWTDDGSTASLINLVKVRWSHWGQRHAIGHGLRVDNHDMDNNGFQRHRVRVILLSPKPAVGHAGKQRQYYTRLRIFDKGRTGVEKLFRPGLGPVVVPAYRPQLGFSQLRREDPYPRIG
jgi:hypothetical protein